MVIQRVFVFCGLAFFCVGLPACDQKAEVKVYRVAKADSPSVQDIAQEAPGGEAAASFRATPPAHWEEQPPSSMRRASYLAKGDNGEVADISVIVFAGTVGGELANVNRWRGQIGLAPLDAEAVKAIIVPVVGKAGQFLTVDMSGPENRILVGWTMAEGRSWFFKLLAPLPLAAKEKEGFVTFLKSVDLQP
jgi:hypothetical protein